MTRYFRVEAEVTFTGEWFVEIDENVWTHEHAIEVVEDAAGIDDPENILLEHRAIVNHSKIWVTDENGERIENPAEE